MQDQPRPLTPNEAYAADKGLSLDKFGGVVGAVKPADPPTRFLGKYEAEIAAYGTLYRAVYSLREDGATFIDLFEGDRLRGQYRADAGRLERVRTDGDFTIKSVADEYVAVGDWKSRLLGIARDSTNGWEDLQPLVIGDAVCFVRTGLSHDALTGQYQARMHVGEGFSQDNYLIRGTFPLDLADERARYSPNGITIDFKGHSLSENAVDFTPVDGPIGELRTHPIPGEGPRTRGHRLQLGNLLDEAIVARYAQMREPIIQKALDRINVERMYDEHRRDVASRTREQSETLVRIHRESERGEEREM